MTFEQFQATRKWTDDISGSTGLDVGEMTPGFVYDSDLHIFAWGGGAAPAEYQLVIFGDETVSAGLEALERKLYEFASDEEMFK